MGTQPVPSTKLAVNPVNLCCLSLLALPIRFPGSRCNTPSEPPRAKVQSVSASRQVDDSPPDWDLRRCHPLKLFVMIVSINTRNRLRECVESMGDGEPVVLRIKTT